MNSKEDVCLCTCKNHEKQLLQSVLNNNEKQLFQGVLNKSCQSKQVYRRQPRRRTISIILLHSFIEIALTRGVCGRFAASLYYKKIIKKSQERLLPNHVFRMIEYLFSRLL